MGQNQQHIHKYKESPEKITNRRVTRVEGWASKSQSSETVKVRGSQREADREEILPSFQESLFKGTGSGNAEVRCWGVERGSKHRDSSTHRYYMLARPLWNGECVTQW